MNITNLPFPFDTENWGRILYCEEPVRGIFELETTRDGGIYVVDRKRCAIRLPPDVFSYGIRYADDAFAYFDFDNGRYVLQHELILHQLKHCLPTERAALEEELFSIAMFGAKDYSGYFGRLTPQYMTPWGPRTPTLRPSPASGSFKRAENGASHWRGRIISPASRCSNEPPRAMRATWAT